MKKFEINRHAYYWAEKLLPSHIEKLKKDLENSEDYESIRLSFVISRAEDDLEAITKRYEEIREG